MPYIDPYLRWALDRRAGSKPLPGEKWPVLIEFAPEFDWSRKKFFRKVVQEHYVRSASAGQELHFVTAFIDPDPRGSDWKQLTKTYAAGIVRVASGRARYAPNESSPPTGEPSATEPRTIIGIIDDGCAFAHDRFRHKDSGGRWVSRIESLWDQGGPAISVGGWGPVPGFRYGRELTKTSIEMLLAESVRDRGFVDEDRVYRLAGHQGVEPPLTHGTHVLDLAAGCDSKAAATAPTIIVVQLPRETTVDTSGGGLALNVLDGLHYILGKTRRQDKLVVNLSYGAMAGPHDGSALLECALDEACQHKPVDFALVLPAGNGFRQRGHASTVIAPGGPASTLAVEVSANDPTETFVELWHPDVSGATIEVVTPSGLTTGPRKIGDTCRLDDPLWHRLVAAAYRDQPPGAQKAGRTVVCLAPTVTVPSGQAVVEPGRWQIKIAAPPSNEPAQPVDAWIERDEPIRGTAFPARRQATFACSSSGADGQGPPIERTLTLNSIAHGKYSIVVGAARDRCKPTVCDYSGCGGTRNGWTKVPDVVALGDESDTIRGVLAAGTRSGMKWRLSGTSVAAPQVTRWIANHLANSQSSLTLPQIRAALAAAAYGSVCDPYADAVGNRRFGLGFIG